jgi:hypothetical protein
MAPGQIPSQRTSVRMSEMKVQRGPIFEEIAAEDVVGYGAPPGAQAAG